MRRVLLAVLSAGLLLGLAAPALAHPTVQLDAAVVNDLTYSATDNVEYLGRFPEHWGTAGGRLGPDGDRFYLTDPRGVFVYDVSDPAAPELLGSIELYQQELGAALAQEEPDTDGRILLVDGATSPIGLPELHVIDVSDPADMRVLSTVDVIDHTWTCVSAVIDEEVNGCAYAYGRTGHIVDLTDPTDAQLAPVTWRQSIGFTSSNTGLGYTHDMTEIRPGLVFTAGATPLLLDTTDPANPVELARIEQPGRFASLGYHSVEWANGGRDPFVVLGTEIAPGPVDGRGPENVAGSDCQGENSVIETWDASEIVAGLEAYEQGATVEEAFGTAEFHLIDSYDAGDRGIFLQGQAPGHVLYCAHWMRLHPDFDAGGLMAVSYYDRGTRFVEIDGEGVMHEVGWMTAVEGYSGSPRWVTDDIVYVSDYRRGLEVLRLRDADATGVYTERSAAIAVGSSYVPRSALLRRLSDSAPGLALGFFGLAMLGLEARRQLVVRRRD